MLVIFISANSKFPSSFLVSCSVVAARRLVACQGASKLLGSLSMLENQELGFSTLQARVRFSPPDLQKVKPQESLGLSGFLMVLKNSGLKTKRSGEFFRPRKFFHLLRAEATERARTNFLSVKNGPQFLKGGEEI